MVAASKQLPKIVLVALLQSPSALASRATSSDTHLYVNQCFCWWNASSLNFHCRWGWAVRERSHQKVYFRAFTLTCYRGFLIALKLSGLVKRYCHPLSIDVTRPQSAPCRNITQIDHFSGCDFLHPKNYFYISLHLFRMTDQSETRFSQFPYNFSGTKILPLQLNMNLQFL